MKRTAFTLVEILIVVIILGILAAIVIPQFTQASNDARAAALVSDLQTVRSQIELYKVQHLDNYPDADNIVNQLTMRTNAAGETGTDAATYPYGPYLQDFPTNPFVASGGNEVGTGKGWTWDGTTFAPADEAHSGL